ncbi:MAG: serine/threonine protein kinase [Cyanobacteria bacterium P01_A01_bin.83]
MTLSTSGSFINNCQSAQQQEDLNQLIASIYQELLPDLKISSIHPHNPVVVHQVSKPWQLLGTGNYAAVFYHSAYSDLVIKIYAPGRAGWSEEVEVYRRLGMHPAFSKCFYAQDNFLVLQRLYGTTLYDAMHQGIAIPPQVIKDIDLALEYARSRNLYPHDVHGRNVMISSEGKGLVVDISDFLKPEPCGLWSDLKQAYSWLYVPLFSWHRLPLPYFMLDLVRGGYRTWRHGLKLVRKV